MALPDTIKADIKAILTAPDVDLDSISAKRVRKALEERYPELDTKTHKSDIDAITVPLFHEVRAEREAAERARKLAAKPKPKPKPAAPVIKRKRSPSEDGIPSSSPFPLSTNGTKKNETDEEVARRLHEDLNGHTRSSRAGSSSKLRRSATASSGSRKFAKKKSSAFVDDSDSEGTSSRVGMGSEDEDDGEGAGGVKKAKRKRKSSGGGGGGGGGGYNKEMTLSPALAELVGCQTCSRPQVVKRIWAHIKANDLQNPNDKRQIICDEPMKKVFNVPSVHMFTMNKLLGGHLYNTADIVS